MNDSVYEIVLFQLRPGIDRQHYLDVTTRANDWLRAQSGFISREILEDASGQWLEILRWDSTENALAAAAAMGDTELVSAIMEMVVPETTRMLHPQRISAFNAREGARVS